MGEAKTSLVGKEASNPKTVWFGLDSISSALQTITGSKWAEDAVRNRGAPKKTSSEPLRYRSDPIAWEEVESHASADSCWIVVKSKVYDVTDFAPSHPGGVAILAYGGRDASDVFAAFHAAETWSLLPKYCIGAVETTTEDAMLKSFRRMRTQMLRAGLFKSSKSFYAWKVISLLGIYCTVAGILMNGAGTWMATFAGAFTLALAWQQSGWLAHDFLHHQVFQNRDLNNAFGYFIGNFLQGFSVDWWKSKHNTHHAVPNECTGDAVAVDPDIDTLPLLAWHKDMLQHVDPSAVPLLKYQQYLFFPILCFARMAWAQQSFAHSRLLSKVELRGSIELSFILLHYAVVLGAPLFVQSWIKTITFFVMAQVLAGFMLALVFVQSHNGMEVYMEGKDFVTAQMVSTRNIDSNMWMDWFTGGLNYQIEHHLFPTLPRHNLKRAKEWVVKFCKEHGFRYESCGMDTGTYRVLERLAQVARHVPTAGL